MGAAKGRKKTGGRTLGTRNKRSRGVETLALEILGDPVYRTQLKERALAGTLPPPMETMLFYYLYGKPVERTALTTPDGEHPAGFPVLQILLTQEGS